ncbi:unnamed protein product [Rotaria socialis]
MFPNVVINAKIHHGSIALTAGDLGTQNVDVVVVCSTSEILLKNILDQAGLEIIEEYTHVVSFLSTVPQLRVTMTYCS